MSESVQELPPMNVTEKLNSNTLNSANINQLNTQYNNANPNLESFNKLDTHRESEDKLRSSDENPNFGQPGSVRESSMTNNLLNQSMNDGKIFKTDTPSKSKRFIKAKPKTPVKSSLAVK